MKTENTNTAKNANAVSENQQSQLLDLQKSFEQRKEYFREKERKVKNLESLEYNIEKLEEVQTKNAQREESSNLFEEKNAPQHFSLEQQSEYGRAETVFKVTNPVLISEVLTLLLAKMRTKADELKADILA